MKPFLPFFTTFFVLWLAIPSWAQQRTNPKNQYEELGKVSWYRNYEEALSASKKTKKPILILFQEVPGCSTCKNYGNQVLSNRLLADAIENEFIPLAIFNNKGGKDREVLQNYGEPSWNNPVVRIVNEKGENLVSRVSGNYSTKRLYNAMIEALQIYLKEIPEYLELLGKELSMNTNTTKEAYFSMYCFWTGEKQLGSQEGVLETEAAYMNGQEVVKVLFNPEELPEKQLLQFAKVNGMNPKSKNTSYSPASNDEDYFIQHSQFKYLPLTQLQRTKINSALGRHENAKRFLSPSQKKWLEQIQSIQKGILFNKNFNTAWDKLALK